MMENDYSYKRLVGDSAETLGTDTENAEMKCYTYLVVDATSSHRDFF